MHIKTLLVLLPLLLNPASSLAIPPAGDQGAGPVLDPSAQQNGDIYDRKAPIPPPFHRGQRNRIENHVKPIKSEKIEGDFGIGSHSGPQKHTLNARSPAGGSKKTGQPDKSKKEKAPAKDNKPAKDTQTQDGPSGTQPQGESSGTQPQGATTRSRKKKEDEEKQKSSQEQPAQEKKKTQGQPSGSQPQPQPGSSEDEDKNKNKQSTPGDLTLTHRPKPNKDDSKDTKTDTPGAQGQPGQTPDQKGDKKDGTDKKDDNGDGKPTGSGDPDKKDDPQDDKKDPAKTMYLGISPDPTKYKPVEKLNGDKSYFRKVGDGDPNHPGRYSTHLPSVLGAQSHNQEPGISKEKAKETGQEPRKRPGEREEEATTGHKTKNEKGEPLTEWHEITPKKESELPKGTKPWDDERFRKNMLEQHDEFPDQKAGDKTSKFGKLTQEMLDMCNTEQCTKQQFQGKFKRAIADQPLLRRRLESLLQERDHIVTMAMR